MEDQILQPDDFQNLINLQKAFNQFINQVGVLEFQKAQICVQLSQIQLAQRKLVLKYGTGTVNMESGVFTPDAEQKDIIVPKIPKLKIETLPPKTSKKTDSKSK